MLKAFSKLNDDLLELEMNTYIQNGFTTFDMADIYGPAEEIFGNFMKSVRNLPFHSDSDVGVDKME